MPQEIQTDVQIANMALRILQSRTIESFDDENDPVASTAKLYYNNILRRCISAYPWSFSVKEGPLQRLPKSPVPRWPYAFYMPVDSVNLIWLRANKLGSVDFRDYELLGGDLVVASVPALWIRYQFEPAISTYPPHFVELLAYSLVEELAAVFGHNLNTQNVYRNRELGQYGALGLAIQTERRQNPPKNLHRPSRLAIARSR